MTVSNTGLAVMLAMMFSSWVFVATFWSIHGGIAATIFSIATMVYMDRLQTRPASGGGRDD